MTNELIKLHSEWHDVFGTDMPLRIACLPIDEIRKALEHGRQRYQPVGETIGSDDSLMEFDNHKLT